MSGSDSIDWDSVGGGDFDIDQPDVDEETPNPDSGGEVEWVDVWDSCNLPHNSMLSKTQIAGAIEVSDATGGASREDQQRLCGEACDAGVLVAKRSEIVDPFEEFESAMAVTGYVLPKEVRTDE